MNTWKRFLIAAVGTLLSASPLAPQATGTGTGAADREKPEIFVQLGHAADVYDVAFSPDGSLIASASDDKTVKIWDVLTGRLVRTLSGHTHFVRCVAWSPDGRLIASGSADETVRLWDASRGILVSTLEGHRDTISGIAFSPDGRSLASCAVNDTETKLWDISSGEQIGAFDNEYSFYDVAFSPDGRTLALVGSWVRLLDLSSGGITRVIKSISAEKGDWSPDGRFLFCAGSGLHRVSAATGEVAHTYTKQSVLAVAVAPDGRSILSSGYDDKATLWPIDGGDPVRSFTGHTDDVRALAFSPDGAGVLTGSGDFTLKLWNTVSGREIRTFEGHASAVNAVTYAPSGGLVYAGSADSLIKLWDLWTASGAGMLAGHEGEVTSLSVSSDGSTLVTAGADSRVIQWDALQREQTRVVAEEVFGARAVDLSSNDRYVIAGRGMKQPVLYEMESGIEIRHYSGRSHFYLTRTSGGSATREDAPFTMSSASFSPDVTHIAGGADDGTLRLWDVRAQAELYSIIAHSDTVFSTIWSHDGRNIFSGSSDQTVKMWELVEDAGFFKPVRTMSSPGHTVAAMALSPNGRTLATASHDRTLKLWNVETGEELRTLRGHKSTVRAVSFSPDGRYLVSGSWDTTLKIWEVSSGREIAMLVGFDDGEWVIVTPEGYYNSSPQGASQLNVRSGGRIYSIENYVETFFRPDIVKAALTGIKIENTSTLDDVEPPPRVSIKEVRKINEDTAVVSLQIEDAGGGIGDVQILLNDSAVVLDNIRGLKLKEETEKVNISYVIRLPEGRSTVSALAFNGSNTMRSNAETQEVTARPERRERVSLHALVIGINEYENPKLRLSYAVPDAALIAQTFRHGARTLFDEVNVRVLSTREETTRENILRTIRSYENLNPGDLFVFYVASHGIVDEGEYFLITSNVGSVSTRKLKETAIGQDTIKTVIANIPTSKKLIIIDTCNSQALGESLQVALMTRGLTEDTAFKVLSRAVGVTILSATKTTQEALEGYKNHGLFTYVIAEGLRGGADADGDGYVKTFELADYVDNEVPAVAEEVFRRVQYPTVSPAGQGFPIARVQR